MVYIVFIKTPISIQPNEKKCVMFADLQLLLMTAVTRLNHCCIRPLILRCNCCLHDIGESSGPTPSQRSSVSSMWCGLCLLCRSPLV